MSFAKTHLENFEVQMLQFIIPLQNDIILTT